MVCLSLVCGCSKVERDTNIKGPFAVEDYLFPHSFDKTWQATISALGEQERLFSSDKDKGLVVTESRKITTLVAALGSSLSLSTAYHNSYTVSLSEESKDATRVRIDSNLSRVILGLVSRQSEDRNINSLMRQELFRKICINLENNVHRCAAIFPDLFGISVTCSTIPEKNEAVSTSGAAESGITIRISVKKLQQTLDKVGYNPGPIDGVLGPKTRAAIQSYQKDHGLQETGVADYETLLALGF
jgi:hypothetical protein